MQDLSLHVLDIVQNSIRAGASTITIHLREDTAAQRTHLCITDNGHGMSAVQLQSVKDPFYTTRTTRKVGLGIALLAMNAQLTGGDVTIASTEGQGTDIHAHFVRDHLDCPPLGDMGSTFAALVQGHPHIDFFYHYTCDGRSFDADTPTFRQILEGVPLDRPEILSFIQQYIQENTQDCYDS